MSSSNKGSPSYGAVLVMGFSLLHFQVNRPFTESVSRDSPHPRPLTSTSNAPIDVYVMNGLQVSSWELEPTQQNIAHLQQIVKYLETVHNPQSTNTQRLQSQSVPSQQPKFMETDGQRLDQVRDDPSSWRLAIALASHRNAFPDPVRHFGISVIESEIKYFWGTYTDSEILSIRLGLLQLCGEVCLPWVFWAEKLVGRNE